MQEARTPLARAEGAAQEGTVSGPGGAGHAPSEVLERVFGYRGFRGQQAAIIDHVVAGGSGLVLMPTGGGKSLCFQIPALVRPGVAIVVSPLIALMQDQVDALTQAGVAAACMNSSQTLEDLRDTEARLRAGRLDLLYVAPERLLGERTLALLDDLDLALFAIDEAHCVSQWGHDFRPEYMGLDVLGERYPGVPRLALTATADAPTRREILERLGLSGARVFEGSFDRPNIRYRVTEKRSGRTQLLSFLREEHAGDAGIVYCLSRRKVDELATWLCVHGVEALPYHAGMDAAHRRDNQARFLREEGLVMVATIAFGMGIDKSNVRFVAHMDLPKSIEAYYQETGRAGRDGLPSDAWMVYGLQDVVTLRQMVETSGADDERKRVEIGKLNALLGYCELSACRRRALLSYFAQEAPERCGNCDNCLQPPQTWDATEACRKALSCVYRTGQRFGVGHVVDVLMGKRSERVQRLGHERLTTFGIGADLGVAEWRTVFRQLVAHGLLETDQEGYGTLRLSATARPVLRGEQPVRLRKDRRAPVRAAAPEREPQDELDAAQQGLFEHLRAHRRELASNQGVPPYVIFHDLALQVMAREVPRSRAEFARVPGVGEKKLQRYGDSFLAVIAEYLRDPEAGSQGVPDSSADQRA